MSAKGTSISLWRRLAYNHELLEKTSVLSKPKGVLENKENTYVAFNISLLEKDHLVPEQWFSFTLYYFSSIIRPKYEGPATVRKITLRRAKILQTFHYFIHPLSLKN